MAAKRKRKPNVFSFLGAAPPLARVYPDVVRELEGLLALARDGQIHGLLYGVVRANGNTMTMWTGDASQHAMSSAAAQLNWRIQRATAENE